MRLACRSAVAVASPPAAAGVSAVAAAAVEGCAVGCGAGAGAARMLLEQRTDLAAAAVAVLGLGVEPLLVVETLGCVAVRGLPNARVTLGF